MSDHEDHEAKPFGKRSMMNDDGPSSKRYNRDTGDDEQIAVKLLIPAQAVGAIIGKGGESMRQLKMDNNCKVQMSKTSDTYPGTSERVCLLKGKLQNVMSAITSIQEKIYEKCEQAIGIDAFDHKGAQRGSEMKIVMPNTSAGMVIGKSGANIKEIRDGFGCQIQVFPKAGTPEAKTSTERVVTLAHDAQDMLLQACQRVLEKVAADPHHGSEINKEDGGGGKSGGYGGNASANASFTSSQPFTNGNSQSFNPPPAESNYGYQQPAYSSMPQLPQKFNPMNGLGNSDVLAFLDNLQATLRSAGFNRESVQEVMSAMQVLAKYNIMGLGLGMGVAAVAQIRTAQEQQVQRPAYH